jgi:hypothetical protein
MQPHIFYSPNDRNKARGQSALAKTRGGLFPVALIELLEILDRDYGSNYF